MEPLYIVSNIHRSGSSMLMRCLEAGGLNPVFDPLSDTTLNLNKGYIPNPNGFYQFNGQVTTAFYDLYKGRLIKCPIDKMLKLPPGNYKVIITYRDPQEIRMSMAQWTPFQSWGEHEAITYLYDEFITTFISELEKRGDMDVTIINYNNILEDPKKEFDKLVAKNWPIDISKMIEKVDFNLYRNKNI